MLRLTDMPWQEVRQAVADICERLDTYGATRDYDLYVAVAREWVREQGDRAAEKGRNDDKASDSPP